MVFESCLFNILMTKYACGDISWTNRVLRYSNTSGLWFMDPHMFDDWFPFGNDDDVLPFEKFGGV